ncbi:GDSL esterase/lipase At2g03980-like [Actinidia eriantha]|uniref:GDSL esterase/lipase At2g03980-like n=1 Tax=Actinidia eriantha TaxID=165200 RepID=UPI00258CC288|nr:GDSL esterase/lipase At2g03980-like [Actinidia eriantha]
MSENQEQLLLCLDYNLSVGDAHSGATVAEERAASTLANVVEVMIDATKLQWLTVNSNVDPGDSINVVDPETKYTMKVGLMADFPPYGIDFDNMSMATGRFKNGKTAADFLACLGGQPLLPSAYTSMLDNDRTSVPNASGINYASSGCGILVILPYTTPPMVECFNLEKQIDFFNLTLQRDLSSVFDNPEALKGYLSDVMFFISTGVNDFVRRTRNADPHKETISNRSKTIHSQQHRPSRMFAGNEKQDCNEELNEVIVPYNIRLAVLLKNLTREYTDAEFFLADSHSLFNEMISYPGQ